MDDGCGCLSRRDVLIASAGTAALTTAEAADPEPAMRPATDLPPTKGRVTLEAVSYTHLTLPTKRIV